jgi:gliding motility-associated-like protein
MKERLCLILILLGLLPLKILAQEYPSKKTPTPVFSIDERKGCAPLSFRVTNSRCIPGKACTVIFGDGRPEVVFTDQDIVEYQIPGNYTMRIIGELPEDNDEIDVIVLPPNQPAFEAYTCQNNEVQIVITDTQFPEYIIDFKEGPEVYVPQGTTPHNYTYTGSPSLVNVEVRGIHHDTPPPGNPADIRADDTCPVATQAVTVDANLLDAVNIEELRVIDAARIELNFPSAVSSTQYKLMRANNNSATGFTDFKTYFNTTTDAVTTLFPDQNFYCFRLDTYSPCGGQRASSDIICSIDLDVTAMNNQNAFTIQTSNTGSPTVTLNRDGDDISIVSPDTDVKCNQTYQYTATSTYPNSSRSISRIRSILAFSTTPPIPVENISSVAGESSVDLEWIIPGSQIASGYIISEFFDGVAKPLRTTTATTYTDNTYKYPTEYTISFTNDCGIRSAESKPAKPMLLTGVLQKDNTVDLTWTEYIGWKNGVDHYELYEDGVLINPAIPSSAFNISIPDDHINQVHVYEIRAVPDPSAIPVIPMSLSNEITLIKSPNLYYPTAFTPGNQDDLNKTFKVFSQYTSKFEFKIFNRWGELMFITTDLTSEGWDGTYKGNAMPEGIYVFTAKITDLANRTFDRSGTVTLLRKK